MTEASESVLKQIVELLEMAQRNPDALLAVETSYVIAVAVVALTAFAPVDEQLKHVFERYVEEFGDNYDRQSFLDFVVATLFRDDAGYGVNLLIDVYTKRLTALRKMFPESEVPHVASKT